MAETLTIRTASSTEVVKIAVPGPQGPKGDKGDPGDVAGLPLSTQGDLLYRGASENQRLPIGTTGQVLKVAGGIPSWANESGAVTSVNGATGAVLVAAEQHASEHEAGEADEIQAMAALVDTEDASLNGIYVPNASGTTSGGRLTLYKTGTRENTKLEYNASLNGWYLIKNTVVQLAGQEENAAYAWTPQAWIDPRNPQSLPNGGTVTRAPLEILARRAADGTSNVATATTSFDGLMSAADKTKLNGIAAGAEVNVQANWTEADSGSDAFILNKPSTFAPTAHAASHASAGSDPLFDQDLNTTDTPSFVGILADSIQETGGNTSINFLTGEFIDNNNVAVFNYIANEDNLILYKGIDIQGPDAELFKGNTRTNLGLGDAATADIGTGSTEVASGDHTHGNLTNDGKIGSTAGLPVVTTTAGAVTTLALGTANQVLRVNSGATGVEFADPAASGVTGAASSASDVLGVSGASITGVDANADRIVYWNNTSNKLAYGTPADAGAAASSHTHAASDVTSGTFDNARINFAAPAAIGNTTPNTGAFTSLSTAPAANTSALTTTGYSLTGSNAQSLVNLAGTWNTTGTPSAFKLNVTDTASNASSLLMQLQTGGTNRFTVNKSGVATGGGFAVSNGDFISNGFPVLRSGTTEMLCFATNSSVNVSANSAYSIGWASSTPTASNADVRMWRDAAAAWALRDGTNAQEMRCYGTYTSSTNYQRMTIKSVRQTLSALSGASATTTGTFIPDGAVVVGVTTRVATALTGATGYTIGDGTDTDRWGDITGTAIGTTSDNRDWTAGTIECFTAGGEITLTAKTSNFTAGAIEICVFYLAGQAD